MKKGADWRRLLSVPILLVGVTANILCGCVATPTDAQICDGKPCRVGEISDCSIGQNYCRIGSSLCVTYRKRLQSENSTCPGVTDAERPTPPSLVNHAAECADAQKYCRMGSGVCANMQSRLIEKAVDCPGVTDSASAMDTKNKLWNDSHPDSSSSQAASERASPTGGHGYYESCMVTWRAPGVQVVNKTFSPVLEYDGALGSHCNAFRNWVMSNRSVRTSDLPLSLTQITGNDLDGRLTAGFKDKMSAERARAKTMEEVRGVTTGYGNQFNVEELNFTPP